MPGPFLNQKPQYKLYASRPKLKASLEQDFKSEQCDVFVFSNEEFVDLWVAVQTANGAAQQKIKEYLSSITGLSITQFALSSAASYGAAIKDSAAFIAIADDFKKSGNILGKYEITIKNGKKYISFKGNHKVRTIVKGTRYLANNTQVINIGVGKKALMQGAKGGFYISVFFSVTLNTVNWIFEDDYRWSNWLATTATDIVKVVIGAALGILVGSFIAAGSVAVVSVGAGILVGIFVGNILNKIDDKLHITESLIKYLDYMEKTASDFLASEEMRRVYVVTANIVEKSIKINLKKEISDVFSRGVSLW